MSESSFEISYALTPKTRRRAIILVSQDVANARGYGRTIAFQLAGGLLSALIVGVVSYYFLPQRNPGVSVLFFGAGFWLCLGLWQRTFHTQVRRIAEEFSQTDERILLRADAGGVVIESDQGQSRLNWSAIRGLKQHGDLIVLRMAGTGLPVPVDALPEGESAEQVVAQLARWKDAA